MKKLVLMTAILFALSTAAFAAETDYASSGDASLGGTDSTPTLTVKLSNNVKMDYNGETTNDGEGYAVAAAHDKGTKSYGSSSGDAKIYSHTTLWTAAPAAPVGTASADFSGWSAL